MLNLRELISRIGPDPAKTDGSYQDSLIRVTKAGTYFTAAFFLVFSAVYYWGGYPRLAVWVNLAALICSLTGSVLISRFRNYRLTAHLVTFAIYLSSAGVVVISGGIHSSSIIWLVFVPVAAFIMAGLRSGLRWGGISLVTVVMFYLLELNGTLPQPLFTISSMDRLFDLSGAILAGSIAIWYSDYLKSRSLFQLEETKAQLNYLATIDPLTNTFNRRHFLELSQRKIKRTHTSQGQASFILFDVDQFKKINDAHGHIIGDQVLLHIAHLCMENLRVDDIIGRFGGEEFVILLPDTTPEDAMNIAERLRLLIADTPTETEIGQIFITISIGVAIMQKSKQLTVDQLLSRADKAMYLAKKAGKNQVMIWDEQET